MLGPSAVFIRKAIAGIVFSLTDLVLNILFNLLGESIIPYADIPIRVPGDMYPKVYPGLHKRIIIVVERDTTDITGEHMRNIIISTMAPVLWIMAILELVSIAAMFKQYQKNKKDPVPLLTGIICIGLFYDALILALGAFMPFGSLLKGLSQFRYVLHFMMIPLLFPLCFYALTENKTVIKVVWIFTILLMIAGTFASINLVTEPIALGVNRYAQAAETPGWVNGLIQMLNIVPDYFMIGVGIYLLIKKKNPHMFLAGFLMLAFTMLGIFLGRDPSGDKKLSLMFYISMYGEAAMVYFLYRYMKKNS